MQITFRDSFDGRYSPNEAVFCNKIHNISQPVFVAKFEVPPTPIKRHYNWVDTQALLS